MSFIFEASPSDSPSFFELYRLVFPEKKPTLKNLESVLTAKPVTVWYCAVSGQKDWCAFLYFWKVPDGYEIMDIGVHPEFRQQGFGLSLLEKLAQLADDEQEKIFLEVAEDNKAAQKLYLKVGFESVGLRKKYYNKKIDAITMTRFSKRKA